MYDEERERLERIIREEAERQEREAKILRGMANRYMQLEPLPERDGEQ
jgi:hypothetical protein